MAHSPEPSQAENTDSTTELKQKVASGPSDNDDRLRMFGGVVDVSIEGPNAIIIPFFNLNYRWSPVKPPGTKHIVRFGFSSEIGTNDIIMPYVKVGPELRLWWTTYVDGHIGIAFFFTGFGGTFAAAFAAAFWGANAGYVLKISRKKRIEFEVGINSPIGVTEKSVFFPYVALGLGFR